jgi:hypothetical protein
LQREDRAATVNMARSGATTTAICPPTLATLPVTAERSSTIASLPRGRWQRRDTVAQACWPGRIGSLGVEQHVVEREPTHRSMASVTIASAFEPETISLESTKMVET